MRSRVRTRKACEIAGIDPARFNEMVHAGHFICAPETRPGSARTFDLDQIVALKIFGELLSLSVAPSHAGQIACAAYSAFSDRQNAETVTCRRDALGDWTIEQPNNFFQATVAPRAVQLVFDISELREQIGDHLDWEVTHGEGER